MRAGDPSDIPNPFSLQNKKRRKPQRASDARTSARFGPAAKMFVLVAIGLAIVVATGSQYRRWLVYRLTGDFAECGPVEKKQRLHQLAQLGTDGISPLVGAMSDDDIEVGRTAYDLLRHMQTEWATLEDEKLLTRQTDLVAAIDAVAIQMADDRTGWSSSLLQTIIIDRVNQRTDASQALYQQANKTLESLALSGRPGPSILSDGPAAPQRLTVQVEPLPVSSESQEVWIDWPPAPEATGENPAISTDSDLRVGESPTVYRSSATRLQTVPQGESVVLQEIQPPLEHTAELNATTTSTVETSFQAESILPVTNLVDSPMETLNDKSVIHWLGSPHQALQQKAQAELARRGYSERQIVLASRIASADVSGRLALVDMIARGDSIDPRPWLVMMLDDESRDVKLRAISVLATMDDPAVKQELRLRLVDQPDPIVAARLRRVLKLR